MSEHNRYFNDENGVHHYDQLHAEAVNRLRECDSFVLITGVLDEDEPDGMRMAISAGIRTPFAPYFMAQATRAAANLSVSSIEDLETDEA